MQDGQTTAPPAGAGSDQVLCIAALLRYCRAHRPCLLQKSPSITLALPTPPVQQHAHPTSARPSPAGQSTIASHLPFEIIGSIVGHLGEGLDYSDPCPIPTRNKENLQALARMCRVDKAWCAATLPVLWKFPDSLEGLYGLCFTKYGYLVRGISVTVRKSTYQLDLLSLEPLFRALPRLIWLRIHVEENILHTEAAFIEACSAMSDALDVLPAVETLIFEGYIAAKIGTMTPWKRWACAVSDVEIGVLHLPEGLDTSLSGPVRGLVVDGIPNIRYLTDSIDQGFFSHLSILHLDGPWYGDLETYQGYTLDLPAVREIWLDQWLDVDGQTFPAVWFDLSRCYSLQRLACHAQFRTNGRVNLSAHLPETLEFLHLSELDSTVFAHLKDYNVASLKTLVLSPFDALSDYLGHRDEWSAAQSDADTCKEACKKAGVEVWPANLSAWIGEMGGPLAIFEQKYLLIFEERYAAFREARIPQNPGPKR